MSTTGSAAQPAECRLGVIEEDGSVTQLGLLGGVVVAGTECLVQPGSVCGDLVSEIYRKVFLFAASDMACSLCHCRLCVLPCAARASYVCVSTV